MGWFHILAFKGIPHGDADNYLSQKFKKKVWNELKILFISWWSWDLYKGLNDNGGW